MGMIQCRECKAEISDTCKACPKCGYTGAQQHDLKVLKIAKWAISAFLLYVVIKCSATLPNSSERPRSSAPAELSGDTQAMEPAALKPLTLTPVTEWEYSSEPDALTGKMVRYASVQSRNQLQFGWPYNGPQRGELTIRQHPQHGLDIIVSIKHGQMLCSSYDGCTVKVRFDEGAPQSFSAMPPSDHGSTTLFITNAKRFIAAMKRSRVAYVQFEAYQQGHPVLEFEAPNLRWD